MAISGGELKTASRGLIGGLHLGDHRSETTVAQAIFCECQRHHLVAPFGIDQLGRRQPSLLKPRRIEIETSERPGDGGSRAGREASSNAGDEQGRGSIVAERRRCSGYLMEATAVEAATRQSRIQHVDAERQYRRRVYDRRRDARLQLGKQTRTIILGRGGIGWHKGINDSFVPLMFRPCLRFVNPLESVVCGISPAAPSAPAFHFDIVAAKGALPRRWPRASAGGRGGLGCAIGARHDNRRAGP